MALSAKLKDNEILILDDLKLDKPKTKQMAEILKNVEKNVVPKEKQNKRRRNVKTLLITPTRDEKIMRAMQNIPFTKTLQANSLNYMSQRMK